MRNRARENPTLVFVTLVLVSFVLMTFDVQSSSPDDLISRFRSGAASLFGPVQSATDAVVDPIEDFIDGVVSVATLRQTNERLQAENDELRAELAETADLAAEVEVLRRMLNLSEEAGLEVPTLLAGVQGTGDDGSLIVDKGQNDGVVRGYPVLDEAGMLIGRVVAVADGQSTIRLLTESVDAVEVTTPQGMRGAVVGLGRPSELRFDVFAQASPVAPETLLSTAGTNGFPPGLQVAFVAQPIEPIGDQITDARVDPAADFGRIPRFVAIVQYEASDPAAEVDEEDGPAEDAPAEGEVPADGEAPADGEPVDGEDP